MRSKADYALWNQNAPANSGFAGAFFISPAQALLPFGSPVELHLQFFIDADGGDGKYMRYLCDDVNGFTSYDRYFEYLDSVRKHLGEELFLFASDPKRHDLASKGSLHDAWVLSLTIKSFYGAETQVRDVSLPDVQLVLLGPYHDRTHTLNYFGVQSCKLNFQFCNEGRKRDLLQHELRYENGFVEHELLFDSEMVIDIVCRDMQHVEHMVPALKI